MGFLQPISREEGRSEGLSITVDKFDRICLSADLKRKLYQDKTDLFLYWDEDYRRMGISKECKDKNIVPYPFDNRGYCSKSKNFIRRCHIGNDNSVKFHYEGMEGDIYVFSQSGRRATTLRMDKNGNLERD